MLALHPAALRLRRQAPARPSAFAEDEWTVTDSGDGATLAIDVLSPPDDGGATLVGFEARLDDGPALTLPRGAAPGARSLTAPSGIPVAVTLRAVSDAGAGAWSAPKTATVADRSDIAVFLASSLIFGVAA